MKAIGFPSAPLIVEELISIGTEMPSFRMRVYSFFLEEPAADVTNNLAERSLRPVVM